MTDGQRRNPRRPGPGRQPQQASAAAVEARCASGERFAPDLKAFADGEVASPLRRFAITRHVAACAACRDEIEAMRETTDELKRAADAADVALSPALRSRLLDAASEARRPADSARSVLVAPAAAQMSGAARKRDPAPLWRQRPALVLGSGAAALALFVAIFIPLRERAGSVSMQAPAADLTAAAPPPVEAEKAGAGAGAAAQQGQPVESRPAAGLDAKPAPSTAAPTAAALTPQRSEEPASRRTATRATPEPEDRQAATESAPAPADVGATTAKKPATPPTVAAVAPRRRSLAADRPGGVPASATGNAASLVAEEKGAPRSDAVRAAATAGEKKERAARTGETEWQQSAAPAAGGAPGGFGVARGGFGGASLPAPASAPSAPPPPAAVAAGRGAAATPAGTRSAAVPAAEPSEVTVTIAVADLAEAEAKVRKIVAEAQGTVTEVRAEARARAQARDADLDYYAQMPATPGITSRLPSDRVEEAVGKLTLIGDVVDRKTRENADATATAGGRQQQRGAGSELYGAAKTRPGDPAFSRGGARADNASESAPRPPERPAALAPREEAKRLVLAPKTTLIVRLVAKKEARKAAEPSKKNP